MELRRRREGPSAADGAVGRDLRIHHVRGRDGVLRSTARHARAHDHGERLLQGLRHDRLAARLCRGPRPHRQGDEPHPERDHRRAPTSSCSAPHIAALEGPRDEVERMRRRIPEAPRHGAEWAESHRRASGSATFRRPSMPSPTCRGLLGTQGREPRDSTRPMQLCDWLLEHHGVATVPGTAFGAPGSIRLSFACSEADIAKAMERMQTALGSLG